MDTYKKKKAVIKSALLLLNGKEKASSYSCAFCFKRDAPKVLISCSGGIILGVSADDILNFIGLKHTWQGYEYQQGVPLPGRISYF